MHEILAPQLFLMSNVLAINFQIGKKKKPVAANTLVVNLPKLKKMKNNIGSKK